MIKKASYVSVFCIAIAVIGVITFKQRLLIGPVVLGLTVISVIGIHLIIDWTCQVV